MIFSPPSHLRRLNKPAVISKDQYKDLLASLHALENPTAEAIAEWAMASSLKDLLKFEAFRSFRIARVTDLTFSNLDNVGVTNVLAVGASRQGSLIANTLKVHNLFPAKVWYEVSKATFRAFYKIWLQEEVQHNQQANYPETI